MYNWRLLLLAFFAVFQPIASFTDRNIVDGRQQCCDHRLERDSSYSLYGNSRLKLSPEDRGLTSQRREIREARRDERRFEISTSRPAIDSLRDSKLEDNKRSLESLTRSSRIEFQRKRESHSQDRNGFTSVDRTRLASGLMRSTPVDRIRSSDNRRFLHRDVASRNSREETNRESRFRQTTRDVTKNVNRLSVEQRSANSLRGVRLMRDSIDEVRRDRDIRNTRDELRRTRETERNVIRTERPTVQYDRRIDNVESVERRKTESRMVRNQRDVRSADRLSRDNTEYRRFTLERERTSDEDRNVRARSRNHVRSEDERRAEVRSQNRVELNRKMVLRSSTAHQRFDVNRNRQSVSRSIRRENQYRPSRSGDRAYDVEDLRDSVRNDVITRSERRIARERIDDDIRSAAVVRSFNDVREQRTERSLSADRRSIGQERYIREDHREQSRADIRSINAEDRRAMASRRLSRSESRLTDNSRAREIRAREINENRRISSERITRQVRDTREPSREIARDSYEIRTTDSRRSRSHIRSNDMMNQRRDESRQSHERAEHFRERISSEQRPARQNQRRIDASRNDRRVEEPRQRNTLRQFRERTSSESNRMSLRLNARETTRDMERTTRNANETRNNVSTRRMESRTRREVESTRNYAAGQKVETDNQTNEYDWKYLIYTLQGIYLCSILMPMIMAKDQNKKIKNNGWWTSIQGAIKTD